jgi:thiamine biosynthesis lipoprotein
MRMPGPQPVPPIEQRQVDWEQRPGGVHAARFLAMGCPCEILVAADDVRVAEPLAREAVAEAWRIERKFSRYRPDSVVAAINASAGRPVPVDAETQRLLDYAAHCHVLSGGLFDITSGVLRRAWTFDGSERVPDAARIAALRPLIGFERLRREGDALTVPEGMEIDLGGLAKEYAVDRALEALQGAGPPVLVNFGGDLRASAPPGAHAWQVGVESVARDADPAMVLELTRGALATSGDAHRYVQRAGVRYGHILDPRTGWPVQGAPRSVTVAAASCVEAGTLSTIGLLQGAGAEAFLDELRVRYWCIR